MVDRSEGYMVGRSEGDGRASWIWALAYFDLGSAWGQDRPKLLLGPWAHLGEGSFGCSKIAKIEFSE